MEISEFSGFSGGMRDGRDGPLLARATSVLHAHLHDLYDGVDVVFTVCSER